MMLEYTITQADLILAIIASVGGCAIRYGELYKRNGKKLALNYLFIDLFIAAFLGFFIFQYVMHEQICTIHQAMLLNCFIGFIGSKVFDIACYFIYLRLGIQLKFDENNKINNKTKEKEEDAKDSSRH